MGRRGRTHLNDESFFFITTTVVQHARVFAEAKYCDILIKHIRQWQSYFEFSLLSYVIMPSHLHAIVKVQPEKGTISDVMREIKSHAAWEILDEVERDGRNDLSDLFRSASEGLPDQSRRLWMKRFDDQVIRNQQMFMAKLWYIHNNPVKAGLVASPEEYKYSSARNYLLGEHSVIVVDTSYAG
jgi:putative transposase